MHLQLVERKKPMEFACKHGVRYFFRDNVYSSYYFSNCLGLVHNKKPNGLQSIRYRDSWKYLNDRHKNGIKMASIARVV